jgi:hypothetical protein
MFRRFGEGRGAWLAPGRSGRRPALKARLPPAFAMASPARATRREPVATWVAAYFFLPTFFLPSSLPVPLVLP